MNFDTLPYDISRPGLLIENYPELAEYSQFSDKKDDIYVKLAILITDENSPIVRLEKNFKGIVAAACSYLKIEDNQFVESLILGASTNETNKVFNMQSA